MSKSRNRSGLPDRAPADGKPERLSGAGAGAGHSPRDESRRLPASSGDDFAASTGGATLDLRWYWQVIRRRRDVVLGVFAVVVVAVTIGTFLQTPIYRAGGTIEIREQAAEVVPVEALFQQGRIADQYLETQYEVLRSPTLARRVVADLGLTEVAEFAPETAEAGEAAATGESAADDRVGRVADRFRKRLIVDPVRGSRLIRVSVESEDPVLAAQAVNSVFANYLDMRVEAGRAVVDQLSGQVNSVRAKLAESEARLQRYVRQNDLLFLENGAGETDDIVSERLRQLQQQLTAAEATRYETESQYRLIQERGYASLDSEVLRTLSIRVAELRGEYAKLRSTFSDEYPRTRQVKTQLDELEALLAQERGRIAARVRADYLAARRHQGLLQQAFDRQHELADRLTAKMAEYRILRRDVEGHQQLYALLQQKRKEAEVSAALAATEVGIVDPAVPPRRPVRPSPKRNLPLSAVAGLVLGLGLAFLREYMDTTVKSVEEVDTLSDVPVLGMIPSVRSLQGRPGVLGRPANGSWLPAPATGVEVVDRGGEWHRIDRQGRRSALTEAFGSLRTSVLFNVAEPVPRSLLVTSAQPGEGKTTVSVNLAISLARLGRRVLLVDADVRRPSVHRAFRMEAGAGLVDYLRGTADWRMLVRPGPVAGFDILPAGRPPGDPSEMLSSGRVEVLKREAEAEFDFVVLDSPALFINAADTRILASTADAVILVVRSGTTPREVLQRALKRIPNLSGLVLNDLDARQLPGSYWEYASEAESEAVGSEDAAAAESEIRDADERIAWGSPMT